MAGTTNKHRSTPVYTGLIVGGVVLLFVVSGCSTTGDAGTANPASGVNAASATVVGAASKTAATQTSEGGQVTVAVTWRGDAAEPVFTVALDTHSVDLDAVDLSQLATLRTDAGAQIRPTGWDAPKGGHHRSGTLTFPKTTADGSPVLSDQTKSLELVIRDVAGISERRFAWTLQ